MNLQGVGLFFQNLAFYAPTPQNGQTHSKQFVGCYDELFEQVWPFCEVGA